MVAYEEVPDYIGVLIGYLKSQPGVIDLAGTSPGVTGRIKAPYGGYRVAVMRASGLGNDPDLPFLLPRVLLRCYGPSPMEAQHMWRRVHPVLVPSDAGRSGGFTRAGCRFRWFRLDSGPIGGVDPDADGWNFVDATYLTQLDAKAVT